MEKNQEGKSRSHSQINCWDATVMRVKEIQFLQSKAGVKETRVRLLDRLVRRELIALRDAAQRRDA